MKKVIGSFMMFLLLVCGCSAQKETTPDKKESKKAEVKEEVKEKNEEMKPEEKIESNRIRLKVGDQEIYATLLDNPTADSLKAMLPVTMTFEDFNNTEKIAYPKTPFTLEGTKKGAAPAEGDILVYAPWGNLSIFYHEYNYTDDLLAIGHIDEGLDILTSQTEDFKVTIELSE